MNPTEVPAVLDVHPPHQSIHGKRDFFLHLFTITIGLLIALSLEGLVEWQHHRHLVHEAEASLYAEIQNNAKDIQGNLDDLHKQQANLKHDVVVLKYIVANHKMPEHDSMDITFHIQSFESVSWATAQNTGALAYMPYDLAQVYSDIYSTQAQLFVCEQQAARDAIISLGPFLNMSDNDPAPTAAEAGAITDKIEVLQGQLLLVDSFMKGLAAEYKKFLAAHPN
jgi:hypothetical protein